MADRVLHCSDYEPNPRSPLCEWLRANRVDPGRVPLTGAIIITGGQLTVPQYADLSSVRSYQPAPGVTVRTVPLISPPEAHGL